MALKAPSLRRAGNGGLALMRASLAQPPPPLPHRHMAPPRRPPTRRRGFTSGKPWRKPEENITKELPEPAPRDDGRPSLFSRMVEAAATSFASILVLGSGFALAGFLYHKFYKSLVLRKMHRAFEPGDPVLDLAAMGKDIPSPPPADHWVSRPEQPLVDAIVDGTESGHYHLLIGEKGTGKSSMLLEAMRRIDGDGVAMFEAHADLEIFRIRLGKALDYEFHEDYIGGYFSEKGPRESSSALLDIERALNKLEKVALERRRMGGDVGRRRRMSHGRAKSYLMGDGGGGDEGSDDRETTPTVPAARRHRPLVLIINQMHLVRDDEDGKDLLELLQQRAEQWAASGLVTIVFNSDDYWVYERLKQLATRLEVLTIGDLPRQQAIAALRKYRARYFGEATSEQDLHGVYDRIGGRLTFLNRVARAKDMRAMCDRLYEVEKTWFLNQCWVLGEEMDDDVMDQQKWASSAMVLAQALVDLEDSEALGDSRQQNSQHLPDHPSASSDYPAPLSGLTEAGDKAAAGHQLPSFPMHIAQQLMTRSDFIRQLDRLNLFTITPSARVRASSVPMQQAFRDICGAPGFREHLNKTLARIADIESLGRTRELVAKDLALGGSYEVERGVVEARIAKRWLGGGGGGRTKEGVTVRLRTEEDNGGAEGEGKGA